MLKNLTYRDMVRWWLTGILFLLPFQRMVTRSITLWSTELSGLSKLINYIDEITIILLLPIAIAELLRNWKSLYGKYLILYLPLFFFIVSGLISGIINGNSFFITILGIADYIKYFFVILIYSAFFKDFSDFRKIFRPLLILAVFLGMIALIQEIWALVSRYALGKDIKDLGTYFLSSLPLDLHRTVILDHWRFGIFRAPSLVRNPNLLGVYSLLFLTIYIFIKKKVNIIVIASLLSGVFFSVSRRTYISFVVLAGIRLFRSKKRWGIIAIIAIVITLFSISSFINPGIMEFMKKFEKIGFMMTGEDYSSESSEAVNTISYRKYAKGKAMEIWRDYPLLGIGPGMFGGKVSVRMHLSPVYEEYYFIAENLLTEWEGIDQFWPQALAETGIIGTLFYAYIFVSLFVIFIILRKEAYSEEIKGLFSGLTTFIIVIVIYSLGGIFNFTSVMFTYLAFAGIGLGCADKYQVENTVKA